MNRLSFAVALILSFAFVALIERQQVEAVGGSIPPWPVIYTGAVTLAGQPAPDGMYVVGKMPGYVSVPAEVKNGRISGLAVGGPDVSYRGRTITFELRNSEDGIDGGVIANETDVFLIYPSPMLKKDFDLNFPAFPTPTPLPTATATATPVPTATPPATATPIAVGPIVYSGMLVASGGQISDGASLTARVGNYSSAPVEVKSSQFISLIIDLEDPAYTGEEVTFYLDGIKARTTAKYEVGPTIRNIDLIFMDLPDLATSTPLPMPTTPPAPTAVPTVEMPTPDSSRPADIASGALPMETPTPIVLVVTATPEIKTTPDTVNTADIIDVEEEKETDSGGCMAVSDIDPLTGTANVLAMIGPLLLLGAFRGVKKFF